MGCDIHTVLEVRKEGKWVPAEIYCASRWLEAPALERLQVAGRHYEMFAALCGVRGIEENPKISEPRGIPKDASRLAHQEHGIWDCDAHSASWVLFNEILEFQQKYKTVKRRGMISREQAEDLDKGILPGSWCRLTSEDGYVTREWEAPFDPFSKLIDRISWQTWETSLINAKNQAADVRLVFWFDN